METLSLGRCRVLNPCWRGGVCPAPKPFPGVGQVHSWKENWQGGETCKGKAAALSAACTWPFSTRYFCSSPAHHQAGWPLAGISCGTALGWRCPAPAQPLIPRPEGNFEAKSAF